MVGVQLEMELGLNKDDLLKKLSIATKVVGNRHIAYADMNYLTVYAEGGRLWYQALGDGHELVLDVSEFTGEGEANIEYGRFGNVLKILNEEVGLQLNDSGIDVTDGSAKATLASYEIAGVELDKEEIKERIETAKSEGHEVEKAKFLEALVYLHGLRGKDAEEEMMEDIYFTEEYAFIFDNRYVVRLMEESPVSFALDGNASETLISFLRGLEGDVFYLHEREEDKFDFVIGDNYYGVSNVSRYIKDISQTMNSFEPEEDMTVGLSEFIRYIELATVFLEDDEEDIVCKIEDEQGRIISDTGENSSDGTFQAEGIDELEIGMNALDILTIIGGLKGTVSEELKFKLNITDEMAYFKHEKGDCLLSILDLG